MDSSIAMRLAGLGIPEQEVATPRSSATSAAAEPELCDELLMLRVGQGSQESLALLFRRYARLVRAIGLRILRDASEAEDFLQDLFLFIHAKAKTFDHTKATARS